MGDWREAWQMATVLINESQPPFSRDEQWKGSVEDREGFSLALQLLKVARIFVAQGTESFSYRVVCTIYGYLPVSTLDLTGTMEAIF